MYIEYDAKSPWHEEFLEKAKAMAERNGDSAAVVFFLPWSNACTATALTTGTDFTECLDEALMSSELRGLAEVTSAHDLTGEEHFVCDKAFCLENIYALDLTDFL